MEGTDTKVGMVSLVSEINSSMCVIKMDNPPIEDINGTNVSTFDPRYEILSDTDNHISKILSINSNDTFSLDDTENILNSTTL